MKKPTAVVDEKQDSVYKKLRVLSSGMNEKQFQENLRTGRKEIENSMLTLPVNPGNYLIPGCAFHVYPTVFSDNNARYNVALAYFYFHINFEK